MFPNIAYCQCRKRRKTPGEGTGIKCIQSCMPGKTGLIPENLMIARRWNFRMTWGFIVVAIIFWLFFSFWDKSWFVVHIVLRTLDLFASASPMLGLRRAARVLVWICVSHHLNFSMSCHLLPRPSCNRLLHFDHKRHSEGHNGRIISNNPLPPVSTLV